MTNECMRNKETVMEQALVDVNSMAKILDVKPSWIYAETRRKGGSIPVLRVGKYLRFNPAEVIEWLKNQK